jgi:Xaa-Pro aminopeptidase
MKLSTGTILMIGASADCPDLEYATGFRAHDPVVGAVGVDWRAVVVPDLEYGRARLQGRAGLEVWTPRALGLRGRGARDMASWALRLLRRHGVRSACVPSTFPLASARRLERAGVPLRVAAGPLFPERSRKRPDEVLRIAESQRAAVRAVRAAIELIGESVPGRDGLLHLRRRPLTSEDVKRRIAAVLLECRCFCRDTIVAGGPQSAEPHEAGHGPLPAGQPIVIDVFPQHLEHGYWGDITRTVVRGPCSPRLRQMFRAVQAAQREALKAVKAGVSGATVHRRAADTLRQRGFDTGVVDGRPVGFIHGTGHGVGLCVHEAPRVSLAAERLRAGHVVTIEPGLYYPELGGIRIEDTVLVTADGYRRLAACEVRFEA